MPRSCPPPEPARAWTLLAVCTAALILPLSFAGGALATPAIGRDLGGGPQALAWITNAFMLSFGSLLMAAGALADACGRKRVFLGGVGLFVLMSLALGLAPDTIWLDALRAVQGAAAAAALAGGSAALGQAYPDQGRTRAFSLLGTSFGVGLAAGPVLAGALLDTLGWRAVFLSSALVGAVALAIAAPTLRESRDPRAAGLDWRGTFGFTAALALLTWGILQAPGRDLTDARVLAPLAGALLCALLFVRIERRVARPMLDLSLFRHPRFVGVQALPVATCYCYVVLLVLMPMRFIGIDGLGEIEAGLATAALSLPMLFMPSVAAWLARSVSPGLISALGLLAAAAGLWWLGAVDIRASALAAVWPMLLIGAGAGLPWGLMDGLAMSVAPPERAGMAAGIFSTTRVAGEGIALASVNALLAGLIRHRLDAIDGMSQVAASAQYLAAGDLAGALALNPHAAALLPQAYDDAFRWLLHALIVITLAGAAVAASLLRERPDRRGAGMKGAGAGND